MSGTGIRQAVEKFQQNRETLTRAREALDRNTDPAKFEELNERVAAAEKPLDLWGLPTGEWFGWGYYPADEPDSRR